MQDSAVERNGVGPANSASEKKKMFLKNSQVSLELKAESTPRNKSKKKERRDSVQSVDSD